jgi:hypothetical protein
MYSLSTGFSFENVTLGTTPMLKVENHLPLFVVENVAVEYTNCVLAEIETEAKRVLGSFGLKEYDAAKVVNIPNDGRLN